MSADRESSSTPLPPLPAEDEFGSAPTGLNIDRKTAYRILALIGTRGVGFERYVAYWVVAIALITLYCYLNYIMVIATAVFTTLLTDYSSLDPDVEDMAKAQATFKSEFLTQTWQVSLLLTFASFTYSVFVTLSHKIAEINRRFVIDAVMKKYMHSTVYYLVASIKHQSLDNMHARLTTDVQQFGWHFVNCLFGNIYYTGIIPTIGQSIAFTYLVASNGGPLPVVIAYLSFVLFVGTNLFLTRWVAGTKYQADKSAHDFERAHAHVQTHAETIAFYRGGGAEARRLGGIMLSTEHRMGRYYDRFFFLNYSVNFFYWFSTILNYALPGVLLIYSKEKIGVDDVLDVITITTYSYYLQSTLVYAIYCSEAFSHAMNHGLRVLEAIDLIDRTYNKLIIDQSNSTLTVSDRFSLRNVTCKTPMSQVLVKNLTLQCLPTDCLLVTGPSGAGKSSLLRVLCGLWPASAGELSCVGSDSFFMMPQKPYLTAGKLREQLTYPNAGNAATDAELRVLLGKVDLDYLLDRFDFDSDLDWPGILSGGEQQRVGMARLLLAAPKFAVIDEGTSAVSNELEAKFYGTLKATGVTFISVAHRDAVRKYHDCVLTLDGKQGYTFERMQTGDAVEDPPTSQAGDGSC